MMSQGLKRLIASKGAIQLLLNSSTRAVQVPLVQQNMQAFSIYNTQAVRLIKYKLSSTFRTSSPLVRRVERRARRRTQAILLMPSSPPLKSQSPLPSRWISHSTNLSPWVMSRRSSQPLTTSLPPRKIPSQADTLASSSPLPLRRAPFTTSTKT